MNQSSRHFTLQPQGPFDLGRESRHFGGWPALPDDPSALVLAFPIEQSVESAAVVLRQTDDGAIVGAVHGGPDALAEVAWRQALAALSLDVDGRAWPGVSERDLEIGGLQHAYGFLRPVLFHSPYEAAASFVLGHRISIAQVRRLRGRLAEALGTTIEIEGTAFHAFPTPAQVLEADELPGVPEVKAGRLRAIALAAEDGWLARERLRALPVEEALARLRTLPGVGPFFASGILFRGAGIVDDLVDDDVTRFAVTQRYGLETPAGHAAVLERAELWSPFRMWAVVLLHVWARNEVGMPPRERARRRRATKR
jgi:DNA-3-methyladenine glycosylase II